MTKAFSVILLVVGLGIGSGSLAAWCCALHAQSAAATDREIAVPPPAPPSPAVLYALAVRDGNCEDVISRTQWMHERLAWVKSTSQDPAAIDAARERLCERLSHRPVEGAQLRPEGIEDACLFLPGCTIEETSRDGGAGDLEQPVAVRVWLRVTYPSPERAVLGPDGRPVRSLDVGLSFSRDDRVLKAAIVGDAEVDWTSLDYAWPGAVRREADHAAR